MIKVNVDYELHPISKRLLKVFNESVENANYRNVADYFGIGKSTIERLVKVPNSEEEKELFSGYYSKNFTIDNMLKIISKRKELSLDYLYCINSFPSSKLNDKAINKELGLSFEAIKKLSYLANGNDLYDTINTLNFLICNIGFEKLLFRIYLYFTFTSSNNSGLYIPFKDFHSNKKMSSVLDLGKIPDGWKYTNDEEVDAIDLFLISECLKEMKGINANGKNKK